MQPERIKDSLGLILGDCGVPFRPDFFQVLKHEKRALQL